MQELKLLDDEANVFKAVGPVLVKQDLVEARSNVSNRLEFIKKDIDRLDVQIKGVESKMLDREKEVSAGCRQARGRAGGGGSAGTPGIAGGAMLTRHGWIRGWVHGMATGKLRQCVLESHVLLPGHATASYLKFCHCIVHSV